ncbi:hypothetical protein [Clostridium thailandense]|uniref:hypothetical protein n=1 Tax=Clostridium thailandense TaxID=2794346 RepID=UPI0039897F1F
MNIASSSQNSTGPSKSSYQTKAKLNENNLNKNEKHSGKGVKKTIGNSLKIKKNKILENLMEQKSNLMDRKKSIMENASKINEDPRTTKDKIEEVDKQIEEIDKQISKIQIEDQRKALGTEDKDKDKKAKKKSNKSPSSDAEANKSSEELNNILSLSGSLAEVATINSQKKLRTGELNVLEAEISLDRSRGRDTTKKEKRSSELKESIENLDGKIGKSLGKVNNKIKENIESDSKNTDVNENEKTQSTKNNGNSKLSNKALIKQKKDSHNIKQYDDNKDGKDKEDGEKIDVTA